MRAFRESASVESALIVGLNWLGDSVMAMPAIQAWRRSHPEAWLTMVVKPKCRDIWRMHAAVDEVLAFPGTAAGSFLAARELRRRRFGQAFVMPNSFRSSLAPFLARIPRRIGLPGHGRDWMLTQVVKRDPGAGAEHQSREYFCLFGVPGAEQELPSLSVPPEALERAKSMLPDAGKARIGLMPGAARGPSKRWPASHFAEAGRNLGESLDAAVIVLGSENERELCADVARGAGQSAVDLSGRTGLMELAALLSLCSVVVANDSGGMHLAAALGVPVVAVFGVTDPSVTGPLGRRVRVLQDSGMRSRAVDRKSEIAEASLRRISPARVCEAALELIGT